MCVKREGMTYCFIYARGVCFHEDLLRIQIVKERVPACPISLNKAGRFVSIGKHRTQNDIKQSGLPKFLMGSKVNF